MRNLLERANGTLCIRTIHFPSHTHTFHAPLALCITFSILCRTRTHPSHSNFNFRSLARRRTSTELQRLESIARSPIFSNFSLVLSGTSVIRAFGAEARYIEQAAATINANTVPYMLSQLAGNWLGLYLSLLSSLVGFIVAVVAVGWPGLLSATWTALALSSAFDLSAGLTQLVRMAAQVSIVLYSS